MRIGASFFCTLDKFLLFVYYHFFGVSFNFSCRLQDISDKKFENQKRCFFSQIKYLSRKPRFWKITTCSALFPKCMFIMLPLNTVLAFHCCHEDSARKKMLKQLLFIRFEINNCPNVIIRKISNFSYLCTSQSNSFH